MKARGIPEPHPDLDSLVATAAALKESVESNAQNLRDRELPSVDRDRAIRQLDDAGKSVSQRKIDAIP